MTSINARHDKRMIKDFLKHVAGELQLQECARLNTPVPPVLQQGVSQLRSKYGNLRFLSLAANDEGDGHQEAAQQAMVSRRQHQLKQVKAVITILDEVELMPSS